ncbi:hypothetical protein B0A50_02707 [Salinomyces thailandicus]|uniref:Indole-diterpene biosynthesis protein PaxU n=1 Tax=Salinomyces thailandicus TaxID=706561 RepID=A0A4V5N558_9PEZI|nr:hypothetical protein B0A50_02707 [Salinomyces thailandica]
MADQHRRPTPRINCEVHRRMSVRSSPASSPKASTPELPWSPSLSLPPQTIVLGLWPYATHEQIQYYVQGYASLYPTANLLLLRYSRLYDEQLGNALDALTTVDEKHSSDAAPGVLLHLFGGCGAAHGCRLLRAYKLRTRKVLGVKAIVLDSVPKVALPTLRASIMSPSLLFATMLTVMTVCYIRILSTIAFWSFDRRCQQNRRDLNDPDLLPEDARKCYIFSEKDIMFTWQDNAVNDNDEDERQDFAVKRTSIDEQGGRWTGDQERYWLGIENVWEGR